MKEIAISSIGSRCVCYVHKLYFDYFYTQVCKNLTSFVQTNFINAFNLNRYQQERFLAEKALHKSSLHRERDVSMLHEHKAYHVCHD